MCRERDSNPHSHYWPRDFKSLVSTNSTIAAALKSTGDINCAQFDSGCKDNVISRNSQTISNIFEEGGLK